MIFLKNNAHTFVGVLLLFCILSVFVNACYEGYSVLVTQHNINSTYLVNK